VAFQYIDIEVPSLMVNFEFVLGEEVPMPSLPEASKVIACVKDMALPAVPEGALYH
jgi:hypothetical protein